jgi:hypothetical protein
MLCHVRSNELCIKGISTVDEIENVEHSEYSNANTRLPFYIPPKTTQTTDTASPIQIADSKKNTIPNCLMIEK